MSLSVIIAAAIIVYIRQRLQNLVVVIGLLKLTITNA